MCATKKKEEEEKELAPDSLFHAHIQNWTVISYLLSLL